MLISSHVSSNRKWYKVATSLRNIIIEVSPRNPNYIPTREDFKKAIDVALCRHQLSDEMRNKLSRGFLSEFLKLTRKERASLPH